jgi:hypothetical protein
VVVETKTLVFQAVVDPPVERFPVDPDHFSAMLLKQVGHVDALQIIPLAEDGDFQIN